MKADISLFESLQTRKDGQSQMNVFNVVSSGTQTAMDNAQVAVDELLSVYYKSGEILCAEVGEYDLEVEQEAVETHAATKKVLQKIADDLQSAVI